MTVHFLLHMQPNPVEKIQRFLTSLYRTASLEAMLVPLRVNGGIGIEPSIVEDPAELTAADPFTPLMILNSARLVLDYQRNHPDRRLGVVMRPCELRAALTLHERGVIDMARVLAVGVDCVGTFGPDDLTWTGSRQPLAEEALRFARQGGINLYRYRPACQMCIDPMPTDADITVDLLGLPALTAIVISSTEEAAERYHLASLTAGLVPPELVEQHDRVRQQVIARRGRARLRLSEVLSGELAMDVDSLTAHLAGCELCQSCFSVCPIFEHIVPDPGNMTRGETIQWLMACAGCGMCEATCSDHLPLTRIINRVKATIAETLTDGDPINV